MTLDEIKAVVSEHFTNYVVVVLDDETGCLDYRFNNDKIGKMLVQEARSDIISYEVDYDVEWDEEEVEGDEF